jgi:hypothetical protein
VAIVFKDFQKLVSHSEQENTRKELFLSNREYIKLTCAYTVVVKRGILLDIPSVDMQHVEKSNGKDCNK